MQKKRDKFKTIGQDMKLKNIKVDDLDDIYHFESTKDTRKKAAKTLIEKGETTFKLNTKLLRGLVIEVKTNYVYKVDFTNLEFGVQSSELNPRPTSTEASSGTTSVRQSDTHNSQLTTHDCILSGRLKYLSHQSRNPVCVGDFVNVDISEKDNFRIEEIVKRKNLLSRYIHPNEVLLAANIDQVVILVSVKDPDFNARLVDRYICAAEILDIPVILCVNKMDLSNHKSIVVPELASAPEELQVTSYKFQEIPSPSPLTKTEASSSTTFGVQNENTSSSNVYAQCEYYMNMGYRVVFTSAVSKAGIDELKNLLQGNISVFTGHSGTGKSTLINILEPGLNLKVGDVSLFHKKGTHTTTSSRMITWSFGGYLIDTPGIKSIGIKPEDIDMLASCFPGFSRYYELCEFNNCSHTHEVNCAIKQNINKTIPEDRYLSYKYLRESFQ